MIIPDPRVFQAARAFAQGEPLENVKELLLNCVDFDHEDAEEIVLSANFYRNDVDGGYNAFICIVNLVLKTDSYFMKRITRRSWQSQCKVRQQLPAGEDSYERYNFKFF
jgi:hypothetical protein